MIEIIQQTEKTEENLEGRLPKNIRQIGNPEKDFRIYMEDYVYTYLHPAQIPGMEEGIRPRLLILLGEINHFSNRSCAFISGAIQAEEEGLSGELPELDDTAWRRIHKEIQQFFDKCEIVGWVLDIPGNTLEITAEMEQVHRRNFVSPYQFFFLMDSKEREEAFFVWKEGRLARKEGYFIYYEKNPAMQDYMISKREAAYGESSPTETIRDAAARSYRARMVEKREHMPYKSRTGVLSGLTSILLIVVLCSVSVVLLANIRRMEDMEQTISVMSIAMDTTESGKEQEENQVAVETVSGTVYPVEDADAMAGKEEINGQDKGNDTAADGEDKTQEVMAQMTDGAPEGAEGQTAGGEEAKTEGDTKEGADGEDKTQAPEEAKAAQAEENQAETKGDNTQQEGGSEAQEGAKPQEGENSTVQAGAADAEQYREQGFYVVQAGDSLRQICYKIYQTYTMLDALCGANGIEDQDYIYVGQKLVLP